MKATLLSAICAILVSCATETEKRFVSENQRTSACHGFSGLNKVQSLIYTQDSINYCEAEKIRWQYDETHKTLSLLHTRQFYNCAAKLKMYVEKVGSDFIIHEIDESDKTVQAYCMCNFDTYCEIQDVNKGEVKLLIGSKAFILNVNEIKGELTIDSTSVWHCP